MKILNFIPVPTFQTSVCCLRSVLGVWTYEEKLSEVMKKDR
jgi:hypothetical protein